MEHGVVVQRRRGGSPFLPEKKGERGDGEGGYLVEKGKTGKLYAQVQRERGGGGRFTKGRKKKEKTTTLEGKERETRETFGYEKSDEKKTKRKFPLGPRKKKRDHNKCSHGGTKRGRLPIKKGPCLLTTNREETNNTGEAFRKSLTSWKRGKKTWGGKREPPTGEEA